MNTISRIIIPSLFLTFASFNVSAQKALDSLLKTMLDNDKVEVIYSETRDPQTRRLTTSSYLLTSADMSLAQKFAKAIKQERENSVAFNQVGNDILSITFMENDMTTAYSLIIDKKDWMLNVSYGKKEEF